MKIKRVNNHDYLTIKFIFDDGNAWVFTYSRYRDKSTTTLKNRATFDQPAWSEAFKLFSGIRTDAENNVSKTKNSIGEIIDQMETELASCKTQKDVLAGLAKLRADRVGK